MQSADVVIIGAGIVGLATAYNLSEQYPGKSILVLDKESKVAQHQTGHNSGVLHSGIYYKPGSLKALNCRAGKRAMEEFCAQEGIPFKLCGKVIVATEQEELGRLKALYERGRANGVDCEIIDQPRLRELEPHCAGLQAIHVRETGIIDFVQVCQRFAERLAERGHRVLTGAKVIGLRETSQGVVVQSQNAELHAQYVINCAGLYSDKVARLGGANARVQIVPFRGEYYIVKDQAAHLCKTLIYPVPDPRFPFLGVHFTQMISGHVECGPNAVLAFAREGYRKSDVNLAELLGTLTFPGFIRMSAKFWKTGIGEMLRSLSKPAFVRAVQRLIPEIQSEQLAPAAAGVRAQAVAADGSIVDDFSFYETPRIVSVLNAPSPAATASLSIGKSIIERLSNRFN